MVAIAIIELSTIHILMKLVLYTYACSLDSLPNLYMKEKVSKSVILSI